MDLLKRWKKAMFVDGGLFFSIVLLVLATFSVATFVDWGGPLDDLSAEERARLEDCVTAERSLGDSIFQERPDCRGVLEPARPLASVPLP